jgi:hypothetical protein
MRKVVLLLLLAPLLIPVFLYWIWPTSGAISPTGRDTVIVSTASHGSDTGDEVAKAEKERPGG